VKKKINLSIMLLIQLLFSANAEHSIIIVRVKLMLIGLSIETRIKNKTSL